MSSTPGVYVNTDVRTGPPVGVAPAGAALFAVGEAQYGSITTPYVCKSMAEFEYALGGRFGNGYLYDTAKTFFEEGGSRLVALRLWKDATPATPVADKVSQARFATSDAADTEVELRAKYLGVWGDSIVATFSATGNTLTITGLPGNRIETFSGLGSADALVAAVNHAVTGSKWVDAEVVLKLAGTPPPSGAATITPATISLTAATAQTTITYAEVEAAFNPATSATQYFTSDYGAGILSAPGYGPLTADTGNDKGYEIWWYMIKNAVRYNRICLFSFGDDNMSAATAVTCKDAFVTYIGGKTDVPATTKGLEYCALYASWVNTPNGVGGSYVVPPDGYVAAARARAHTAEGPQRVAAGIISSALYVTSPVVLFSTSELDSLATASINPIRVIAGSTRVYGARSLSSDVLNWKFITYRDSCNYISYEAESRLEPHAFATIDSKKLLFSKCRGALIGYLENLRQANTLYELIDEQGNLVDPGYSVDVSEALNPTVQLANGIITAQLGVRISPVGERINLTVTKAALTSGL